MKIDKFIKLLEEYYTPYKNNTIKGLVIRFLESYSENELEHIFNLLIQNVSNNFKITPDIAKIKAVIDHDLRDSGLRKEGNYYVDNNRNVYNLDKKFIGYFDNDRFVPNLSDPKIRNYYLTYYKSGLTSPGMYLEAVKEIQQDMIEDKRDKELDK